MDIEWLLFRLPSVLWRCWLGSRKGIRPVKNWVVGCWHGYLSGARCRLAYGNWCHCHSLSLASVKSRLVLPFWYCLTRVVLDKGPLNGCVCDLAVVKWLVVYWCKNVKWLHGMRLLALQLYSCAVGLQSSHKISVSDISISLYIYTYIHCVSKKNKTLNSCP